MILSIIWIIITVVISIVGIGYLILHFDSYGARIIPILMIFIYLFDQLTYFTIFILSTHTFFSEAIALNLWKITIVMRIISLIWLSLIYGLMIGYRKIIFFPILIICFLEGAIISMISSPNSVAICRSGIDYQYSFQDGSLLILIAISNMLLIITVTIIQILNQHKIRDKYLAKMMWTLIINFFTIILLYIVYLITQNIIFKNIHIITYLIGSVSILYITIKKTTAFFDLTNRIYDFIIFHKSGVLLYTYNFETGEETDESILKGSILIGINHILSNFIDRRDQLNLIKMRERDIILEYNIENGYALLLITNHRNPLIEKAVQQFMENFNNVYQESLNRINDSPFIFDVSEFGKAKEILIEFFNPYIMK